MPDPRKILGFEGINDHYTTYKIDASTILYNAALANGSAQVGLAVSMQGNGIVQLTADGDMIIGKLTKVEDDGFCTIQDGGYTTLPGGLAATLTVGTKCVGALGASSARGYIRSVALPTGTYAQATATDAGRGDPEIVDSSDPTNVVVNLA